jgi:hypothetical protein
MKRGYPGQVKKNNQMSNFMKVLPIGAEFFHADGQIHVDGQTDMMHLIVAF